MAEHSDTRIKRRNIWWYIFRMKKYIKPDKLEERIIKMSFVKGKMFDASKEMGQKAGLIFEGTVKDAVDNEYKIRFVPVQIFEIPFLKYFLIRLIYRRIPILVNQIFIDDVPVINKWYKKLNYPKTFVR